MERLRHWWNTHWGRIGRRDIYLHIDGDHWYVEAREGGSEGRSRWWEFAGEEEALELVWALMADDEDWREITAGK